MAEHWLSPGTPIAGYVVQRTLAQSDFRFVYEGLNRDLGHRAVIKEYFPSGFASRDGAAVVPRPGKAGEAYHQLLERFIAEARRLNTLHHPGIVRVRHLVRANDTAYVVMDFVEGVSLANWLEQKSEPLVHDRLRTLFEPIMDALAYGHAQDLLHRDISPANIMIDGSERPILIEFGAMLVTPDPAYAAPEQLSPYRHAEHGPQTDVFALAAMLYQAIAGVPPEPSEERARVLLNGDADPYQPVESMARIRCPPQVFTAIDQALRLNPSERPPDIPAFRRALGWDTASGTAKPDDAAWAKLGDSRDPNVLRDFLDKFPTSPHARDAYQRLVEVEEERWAKIPKRRSINDVRSFLADFKGGQREKDAQALLAHLIESGRPDHSAKSLADAKAAKQKAEARHRAEAAAVRKRSQEAAKRKADAGKINRNGSTTLPRRALLAGGVLAGAGALGWSFVPGNMGWRLLFDRSIRTVATLGAWVNAVALSSDGKLALTGRSRTKSADEPFAQLWDVGSGRHLRDFRGHIDSVRGVALSPDGKLAASCGHDGTIRIWEVFTSRELHVIRRNFTGKSTLRWIFRVAFVQGSQSLVSSDSDGEVKLWNTSTGRDESTLAKHTDTAYNLAISTDGQLVASAGHDKMLRVSNILQRKETLTIRTAENLYGVAISPNNRHLLSGNVQGEIKLWDVASGRELRSYRRLQGWIQALAFSPNGSLILAGEDGGDINIFETETGRTVATLKGHRSTIMQFTITPDGRQFLSASGDGTVKLWNMPTV